jgi:Transglycosylase SLT domain
MTDAYSADPSYVARLFQIESGGNPNAVTGSNRGLGQFGPSEEAQFGINNQNRTDPNAQAAAVQQEAALHAQALQKALGRLPSPGELYLTHQQGAAGGPALLTADPSQPAWQTIRPYYKSDAVAQKAITGNIPSSDPLYGQDPNSISAGAFRNMWVSKFEKGMGGQNVAGGPAPSAAGAVAPPPGAGGAPTAVPPGAPFDPQQATAALMAQQQAPPQGGQGQEDFAPPPAPPLPQMPINLARLRNVMALRPENNQMPLPPDVAQRLAALMGRG